MNGKTEHLEAEELTDFVLDEISAERKTAAALHLEACRSCSTNARRIEQTLLAMRTDKMEDVPTHLSERVIDFYDEIESATAGPIGTTLIEKLTAILTFDKLVPVTGLRAGENEFVRQMIFAAGEILFEMGVEQTDIEHWRIVGSARIPYIGGVIQLEDKSGHLLSTEIDDLSSFTFPSIESGSYEATFLHDKIRIEFQPRIII